MLYLAYEGGTRSSVIPLLSRLPFSGGERMFMLFTLQPWSCKSPKHMEGEQEDRVSPECVVMAHCMRLSSLSQPCLTLCHLEPGKEEPGKAEDPREDICTVLQLGR